MVWASGYELVSAVSNSGGLGLLGARSMNTTILTEHIRKYKDYTDKPFGVNLPLIYSHIKNHIDVVLKEGIKIIFTSAGDLNKWAKLLKAEGVIVVHVISSARFATNNRISFCKYYQSLKFLVSLN